MSSPFYLRMQTVIRDIMHSMMKSFARLLALLLLAPAAVRPGIAEPVDPARGGDDLIRCLLRASELQYIMEPILQLSPVEALEWYEAAVADGPQADALFRADAPFCALPDTASLLTAGVTAIQAEGADWADVKQRLTVNAAYDLADVAHGAIIRVRCVFIDDCAAFEPLTAWDAATLARMFGNSFDFRQIDCALTIGQTRVAASLQLDLSSIDASAGAPQRFYLYFANCPPKVGKLTGIN